MNRSWLAMVPTVATLLCAPPAAALVVDVGHEDERPFGDAGARDRLADPPRRARDQGDLVA